MSLYALHNPGKPIGLTLGGVELSAFSISGVSTYVMAPQFDACFDLGHCPVEATRLRNVFLTHVHQDHSAGAYRHHALRQMFGSRPSRIHVPHESHAPFADWFRAWERLEERTACDLARVLFPLSPGDRVRLSPRYEVAAFDVVHRIASLGYTVFETSRVLRPEYAGLDGRAIGEARARGERVDDRVVSQLFTYVGDSTAETLRRHPEVGRSRVLFLEATHLPGTDRAVSEKYGHTHIEELAEIARELPEALASPHIVLKHFSTRYKRDEIRASLAALPEDLRARVTLLI